MWPLNIPTKKDDIIMDEKNQSEGVEFEKSDSIRRQYTTYDYNDEFWDSL